MNKSCTKCFIEKPELEFYRNGERLRSQCKTCVDERNKFRYETIVKHDINHKTARAAYSRRWNYENKEVRSAKVAANHADQRLRVINHYGGKCSCCGETTYEFLSIDHVNGGGTKHRKEGGSKICRWIEKNNYPAMFRILCHNCNQAYGFYGSCPHQEGHVSTVSRLRNTCIPRNLPSI